MSRFSLLLPLAAMTFALAATSTTSAQEETSRWKFGGDFRLRAEFNDNNTGVSDRHRQRMRFRFGGTYMVNEEITVGVRLRTGNPDDPKNPYQDLGKVFNSFDLNLDRLYVRFRTKAVKGVTLWGGKFDNPIYRNPIYGELVWDADLQPEGFAVQFASQGKGKDHFGAVLGQYAVLEQSAAADAWATLAGVDFAKSTSSNQHLSGGVSYTFFGDLTPTGSTAITGDFRGNSMTGTEPSSDFGIVDAILAYHMEHVVFSGEVINNVRAASGIGNTGAAVGAAVQTGAGKFYYQYSTIEQDAVLTVVSQDDFLKATNFNTHMVGWKKKLSDRVGLHIWLMASEPNELLPGTVDEMVYRFRIDFNVTLG